MNKIKKKISPRYKKRRNSLHDNYPDSENNNQDKYYNE